MGEAVARVAARRDAASVEARMVGFFLWWLAARFTGVGGRKEVRDWWSRLVPVKVVRLSLFFWWMMFARDWGLPWAGGGRAKVVVRFIG